MLTSTVPRFMSSVFIRRRRLLRPSTSSRRRRASLPVTRHPTSANACQKRHSKSFLERHLHSEGHGTNFNPQVSMGTDNMSHI